jgi:UDP-hydrolysing UDP-N-acetyl-D-glucosamine 2-epimerase
VKRKICAVVTARPSYSRIKSALRAIREHPELELQLVVSASALLERYGSAVHYIEEDGFEIAARVYMVLEGENLAAMAKTTGIGLMELATVFDNLRPDAVLSIADRYETIATAIAAAYMNIPLVHVQGGEVTGSIDEKVRHAVTKLSDLHLTSSEPAAERLLRMGERPESVFVTGCPSVDLATEVLANARLDFDPFDRYGGVGDRFDPADGYVVVMQHPVTTEHEAARDQVLETLHAVNELDVNAFWFWPNVDAGSDGTSKGIRTFRENHRLRRIHFFKNMSPVDFLRLIHNAKCLIGNSSVGIRESAFLGVPVVNIGSRQSGRDRGRNVIDVEHRREMIMEAARAQMSNGRYPSDHLYGDGKAGERIAGVLAEAALITSKQLAY